MNCKRIQADEIWRYIGAKQARENGRTGARSPVHQDDAGRAGGHDRFLVVHRGHCGDGRHERLIRGSMNIVLKCYKPFVGTIAASKGQPLACFARSAEEQVLITVGRWMSHAEFQEMITTGRVVESTLNGLTNVIFPASSTGYAAAHAGDHYVEFDVDDSRVVLCLPPPPWGKIYGPGHLFAGALGITDMPLAVNIRRVI